MNKLHIVHLYPNEMNIYGDRGNLLTLVKRMQWHGYEPVVHFHHAGEALPDKVHFVLGGGGQDSAQADIQADILRIGDKLHKLADAGVPMLMICGTYQLFGHRFVTHDGKEIKGIGMFNMETIAGPKRMVGNVMVQSERFRTLFGFENHSGRTMLADGQEPLGNVLRGGGNNGSDKTEGAIFKNVVGAYLHGPMLPTNPQFADELIKLAATEAYGEFTSSKINDKLAEAVRANATKRAY